MLGVRRRRPPGVRRRTRGARLLGRLFESRRARALAGWALAASVGVHAGGAAGVWAGAAAADAGPPAEGPISVRYLLPPDHLAPPVGERVRWVTLGARVSGYAPATGPRDPAPAPGDVPPPEAKRPAPADDGDPPDETRLYTADDVDSAAVRDPASDGPRYPDALRAQGVQGEVLVEFTVDTLGRADTATFTVVATSHPLFTEAVRDVLPRMRFSPAVARGHRVRQVVRLPMKFRLLVAAAPTT